MPEIGEEMNDEMNDETNSSGAGGETNLGDVGHGGDVGEEMADDFRGVLAHVVDGRIWAGYAGPGAGVRRRGQRRRTRLAATSVAGVAVVVAVAASGAGLAAGWSRPGPGALTTGQSTEAGHGRYVKLSEAVMQPADLGAGFTASATTVTAGQFTGLMCAYIAPVPVVGPVIHRGFRDGSDAKGLADDESLYQFPDAASAKAAFAKARSAAQAGGCRDGAGSASSFQDVGGVGDGMFLQKDYGGPAMVVGSVVLEGQVVIADELMLGSAEAVQTLSSSWLADVSQKAATHVRNAPRIDSPEQVPRINRPTSPPTGGSVPGSEPTPSALPVSQPVDGFLFAPADLGAPFGASAEDAWQAAQGGQIPAAASVSGMMFRGTMTGGDGELLVNEGVYTFADASAAQAGLAAYDQSTAQTRGGSEPLSGLGDQAWLKHWTGQRGGATVAIRVGAKVITFDVLAGGASADQPIPGGDAWVRQIAHTAVQRLAGAK